MSAEEPLDKRARLRQRRRERLLGVLPRIYGAQPPGSGVAVLVDALAGRLAALDEAAERVLRDRWVALAGGSPSWDAGPHPLEGLGALLGLERERWEDAERFRRRLRLSAPVLTHGSTSVRSVLRLAAAALDSELCPRLARLPEGTQAPDTTLGLGVKPGTTASCPGCAEPEAAARCVWEREGRPGPIQARMLLTDSPVAERAQSFTRLSHGDAFRVRSVSLTEDRPVVRLTALEELHFPALRNTANNSLTLYAGVLQAGETLVLLPERTAVEARPFEGYTPVGPALQLLQDPVGRARVLDAAGRVLRTVESRIFFLQGRALFDRSVFAGDDTRDPDAARFSMMDQVVLTPRVEPGASTWTYRGYTAADVAGLAAPELAERLRDAPAEPRAGRADLTLEWWVRPPASFRVSVPQMPVLPPGVERSDVLELMRRSAERARAAGVRVAVDFPEPPREEAHLLGEHTPAVGLSTQARDDARASEVLAVEAEAGRREAQPLGEGLFTVRGIFDVTRMDGSRFAP